jgi:hypothetical protein
VATFLVAGSFLLPPLFDAFGASAKDVGTVLEPDSKVYV